MFPSLSFLYRVSNQTLLKCSYSFSLTDFFFFLLNMILLHVMILHYFDILHTISRLSHKIVVLDF
jgi:hypothetical protein